MEIHPEKKFSSPEEEITFLREEIARRERELLARSSEIDSADRETLGKQVIQEYGEYDHAHILEKKHALTPQARAESQHLIEIATHKVEEFVTLAQEKGIRNALSVLEKLGDAFLTDEVHRAFVEMIQNNRHIADLEKEKPLWNVLHMTLFEVSLPRHPTQEHTKELSVIFSAMEQFFAGMQTLSQGKTPYHYAIEIGVSDKRDDIIFYVAVPNEFVNLFEKQALSLFPHAVLIEQRHDYNIFVEKGQSRASILQQKKHPLYPIKTHDTFQNDPLAVILNAFSKIERDGGGASIQVLIRGGARENKSLSDGIIKRIEKGDSVDVAIRKSTITGTMFEGVKDFVMQSTTETKAPKEHSASDASALDLFKVKSESPIVDVNIRLVVSAQTTSRAEQILTELESGFHQFQHVNGNALIPKRVLGGSLNPLLEAYSFREFKTQNTLKLSFRELSTIIHFPTEGLESSPQFKQSRAKYAPAPVDMPHHGTHIGVNVFRNNERNIYITPEDRLRHFYVIGQTGTGKTTLLKNMIAQDIQQGAGVCMIDPHGTDIVDVLSAVPPERIDDVIYFDPSNTQRSIGLNMLEFDPRYPEQKTFVVNELFSMFKKLYGANPESMGPMFEQYFRNAALLVLEDPTSGSTLLDISRVMSDTPFRNFKLSKATNPVVIQFWQKIATKAGGEASLENIVPYIVSKIDPLTANDYMRPIIGQQQSTFNFRDLMDTKKILLVNLSKGRLGEINANLIGMIIVGKILMAALSRVDDPTKRFPPFYLYIDEFQNVTTDSISAILSEARKYKLGLTIAHQFIAQLEQSIRDAVFGNVGSLAAFRVGTEDAEFLERQFKPTFEATDLMNIENRNAYARILADGTPTTPFSFKTTKPHEPNDAYAQQIIEYSSLMFGRSRDEVDTEIRARYL